MKLSKLEIRRGESWNDDMSKPLVGLVELTGETGKQAITLSPGAIARIVQLIAKEVGEQAVENARQVTKALNTEVDANHLIENDGKIA